MSTGFCDPVSRRLLKDSLTQIESLGLILNMQKIVLQTKMFWVRISAKFYRFCWHHGGMFVCACGKFCIRRGKILRKHQKGKSCEMPTIFCAVGPDTWKNPVNKKNSVLGAVGPKKVEKHRKCA